MRLPSRRTWLFVAAGVLVLVGAGIVYVIKNPTLPKGWEWHDGPLYRVALPPGEVEIDMPRAKIAHSFSLNLGLLKSIDINLKSALWFSHDDSADEALDRYVSERFDSVANRLHSCERVIIHGHPARVVSTSGDRERKWLLVLTKEYLYMIKVELIPGVVSEQDADRVFRTFRPK